MLYLLTCLALIITSIFGFRSARIAYADGYRNNTEDREKVTRSISRQLADKGIESVGTTGNFQSIRFFSDGDVKVVFEVLEDCISPVPWLNNSSWLVNQYQSKTAFIVPGDIAPASCDGTKLEKTFGEPNEILTAESGKGDKIKKVSAYIYGYDIRSKLSDSAK